MDVEMLYKCQYSISHTNVW